MRAGLGIYSNTPPPTFSQQLETLTRIAGFLQQSQYHPHQQQQQHSNRGSGKYSSNYGRIYFDFRCIKNVNSKPVVLPHIMHVPILLHNSCACLPFLFRILSVLWVCVLHKDLQRMFIIILYYLFKIFFQGQG